MCIYISDFNTVFNKVKDANLLYSYEDNVSIVCNERVTN